MFCFQCGYKLEQIIESSENGKQEVNLEKKDEYIPIQSRNLEVDELNDKQQLNDRKKQLLVPAILIVLIASIIGGISYSNHHKQQIYIAKVSEANRLFSEEKYGEALEYYEQALTYKYDDLISAKLEQSKRLYSSLIAYNQGIENLDSSVKLSYYGFDKVIPEDNIRYQDSQVKKQLLIEKAIEKAKYHFDKGDDSINVSTALEYVRWVLQFEPDNLKAKELYKPLTDAWEKCEKKKLEELKKSQKERERVESERAKQEIDANNQKIVDSNGKQIWKIYIDDGSLHFIATYNGSGNFIVKLSDSNQDLIDYIANEIGDYKADKTVSAPYKGWYYLEIRCTNGSWTGQWN